MPRSQTKTLKRNQKAPLICDIFLEQVSSSKQSNIGLYARMETKKLPGKSQHLKEKSIQHFDPVGFSHFNHIRVMKDNTK